jgi:hypothetical protein
VERGIHEISSPWLHLKWELNLRMPPLRGHIPYTYLTSSMCHDIELFRDIIWDFVLYLTQPIQISFESELKIAAAQWVW